MKKIIYLVALLSVIVSVKSFSMGRGAPVEPLIDTTTLKEGDIVFIQSQTQQAAALREAQSLYGLT